MSCVTIRDTPFIIILYLFKYFRHLKLWNTETDLLLISFSINFNVFFEHYRSLEFRGIVLS
jgi:hypothetical protein